MGIRLVRQRVRVVLVVLVLVVRVGEVVRAVVRQRGGRRSGRRRHGPAFLALARD
jgi:hypothetical protein